MNSSFPSTDRIIQKKVHGLEITSWSYLDSGFSEFFQTDFWWRWISYHPSKTKFIYWKWDRNTKVLKITPGEKRDHFPLGFSWNRKDEGDGKRAFLFSHLVFCSFFFQSKTFHIFGVLEVEERLPLTKPILGLAKWGKKPPFITPFPSLVISLIQFCFWILLKLESSSETRSCHFTTVQFQSIN